MSGTEAELRAEVERLTEVADWWEKIAHEADDRVDERYRLEAEMQLLTAERDSARAERRALRAERDLAKAERDAAMTALDAVLALCARTDGIGSDYREWDTVLHPDEVRDAITVALGGAL